LPNKSQLVALAGYARAGKDVLADEFVKLGFVRLNFGDFIKQFYDPFLTCQEEPTSLMKRIADNLHTDSTEQQVLDFFRDYIIPYRKDAYIISAYTEHNEEKQLIRPILEHGGELIYGWVMDSYHRQLDEYVAQGQSVINTRLCQLPEAAAWTERGGVIFGVERKDWPPATEWDKKIVDDLYKHDYVQITILNNAPSAELWAGQSRMWAEFLTNNLDEVVQYALLAGDQEE